MNKVKWCFIDDTDRKYIITSTGKVFSAKYSDYLNPYEENYYYRVKIKTVYDYKPKTVSIYQLLKKYFPKSLDNKEYYMNIKRKEKDDELFKKLKELGYIKEGK